MKTTVTQMEKESACSSRDVFFPEGIIGFSKHKRYQVLINKSQEPFLWLESKEDPKLCFVIIDPKEFYPEYSPVLTETDRLALGVDCVDGCQFFTIVVIPEDSSKISANLLAPVVINKKDNIGRQVVLQEQGYSVQHLILEDMLKRLGDKNVSSFTQTE
ncbi:MAG: flagellar assembly protein FliW [Candidatus Omnitrophota bacterium]